MNIAADSDERGQGIIIPYGAEDALRARRADGATRPAAGSSGARDFDPWLSHHLGRLYDPIVQEPIPPELLRLLEIRLK
jgi:hypothetical protein